MLLFFLSFILASDKRNILIIGGGFILGTFIAYFLLGTVLYSVLGMINGKLIRSIITYVMLILVFTLAVLNIKDYLNIKKGDYGKVSLQLPLFLRKLSHGIIKFFTNIKSNIFIMTSLAFLLGFIISFTEFLCTGQIYLPTIVSMIQTGDKGIYNVQAIFRLIIYNIGFVIPLIVICLFTYFGQRILDISEVFRKNLEKIKLANALFFAIIFVLILINIM
ncbi:hypothetical protein [Dethiothermospora halolimnae]|uniref:hypothetical protein n=1 Tax=Dethiothermospora halolimnae TaxID=3114390 RepID=UPI003CCC2751